MVKQMVNEVQTMTDLDIDELSAILLDAGNAVVVPVVQFIAQTLKPHIEKALAGEKEPT